jgi:26S proteasome regulatory subunit N1
MSEEEKKPVEIMVPSEGGERKEDEKSPKIPVQKDKIVPEMSEEDRKLQEDLETAVERVQEDDIGVQKLALEYLRTEIRSATASMTSVPKPLKFLRPYYSSLVNFYKAMPCSENRAQLADILSVLAMTMGEPGKCESLHYKLEGNRNELGEWGHEFVRNLAGEIGAEHKSRIEAEASGGDVADNTDIMSLFNILVQFNVAHNAEAEAVDLLMEMDCLPLLLESTHIDSTNCQRVCLYLLSSADFTDEPEDEEKILRVAFELYQRQGERSLPDAFRVALRMRARAGDEDDSLLKSIVESAETAAVKRQLAYMRGRAKVFSLEIDDEDEVLTDLASNAYLSDAFATLARELDTEAPKTPEDIYKSHLADGAPSARRGAGDPGAGLQSARGNLASTFVNAFVNAGYCRDTLMTPDDSQWVYSNKDHGKISATASIGMLLQWNLDDALNAVSKYTYTDDDQIKAGAFLGVGIATCGVRDEADSAFGLLSEHLEGSGIVTACAALGLGLAYCGAQHEEAVEGLLQLIQDTSASANMEVVSMAALAVGLINVGTSDDMSSATIIERLMEASEAELDQSISTFLVVGLGLLFLGRGSTCEAMLEALKTVEHKLGRVGEIFLEAAAYAGTGNVLQIQKLLHLCAEHLPEGEGSHQSMAVLGIALIAMGEDVGEQMVLRTLNHLLQYGEQPIRLAVPLAMALLNVSRPEFYAVDMLSKLSHDTNTDVAASAIFGLGMVSAGTNNSRVAGLLRQLSTFYRSEPNLLFMVRLAQGLLHSGKGLVTLSPFYSDRLLLSPSSLSGIVTVLVAAIDSKNTLLGKFHYLMFALSASIWPRMLMTVDEEGESVTTTVRVGKAVDTVGQPGRRKTITGFQTNSTPVLLGVAERAELATDMYLSATTVLEGMVVLTENPDSEDAKAESKR